MSKVAILGCGWLGLPLARVLISHGYKINGSTTSPQKIPILKEEGIHPFLISLNPNSIEGDIHSFLKDQDVLIVDIPPNLRGANAESYVSKIALLSKVVQTSSVKKLLFISSTSVYKDVPLQMNETILHEPDTESGRQLLASENLLNENSSFATTILRFGGLLGPDRHPVKFLSGKSGLSRPFSPVNLIHLDDCINIIKNVLEKDIWEKTFNAVSPGNKDRKTFYTEEALKKNLPVPEFDESDLTGGKKIVSDALIREMNYTFEHSF